MLTEDYLMRMIRMAVAAIAKAIGLKAMELYTDALYTLDQALEGLFGLRPELLNGMDEQSIYASLTTHNGFDSDRLLVAADVYREQAEIYASIHDEKESRWRFLRALNFYLEVGLRGGLENFAYPDDKIEDVVAALDLETLPTETLYALSGYWEDSGKIEKAAQALEQMLRGLGGADEAKAEVRDFYTRLLEKTDAELMACGLPREEIERRIAALYS